MHEDFGEMSTINTSLIKRKAVTVAGTAVFSALVAIVEYLSLVIPILRIPFPLMPELRLKFDMAEIPAVLSYFVYGLPVGILTSIIVPLIIIARGTTNPIGAWLKGLAILTTVIGLAPFWKRNKYLSGAFGTISRVVLMSIVNLVSLPILYGYSLEVTLLFLPWIGFFNLLHALLTIGGSSIIYSALMTRLPRRHAEGK